MPHRRRREDGAALVEFAVCLPFLAVIVFGTIDIGRVYQTQQQLKNAAREGAIYASRFPGRQVTGSGCADPNTVVWHANNEGRRAFTITVNNATPVCNTSPSGALAPGQPIKVRAATTFTPVTPMVTRFIGDQPTISASVCVSIAGATPNPSAACP